MYRKQIKAQLGCALPDILQNQRFANKIKTDDKIRNFLSKRFFFFKREY